MKILIVGAVALLSSSVFAQANPAEVCNEISRWNAQSGAECGIAISRGFYDSTVADVALTVARTGSPSAATRIMKNGVNRYLDDDVAAACKETSRWNANSAADCVDNALDNAYEPALANVALAIAKSGSATAAALAIRNAANGSAHPSAANVCVEAARWNANSAADCVTAILNKDYFNNAEQVCMNLAKQGSPTSAVTCLRNGGVQTQRRPSRRPRDWDRPQNPGPQFPQGPQNPGPQFPQGPQGPGRQDECRDNRPQNSRGSIVISKADMSQLELNLSKAQSLLRRNQTRQVENVLLDIERQLIDIKAQQ